MADPTLLSLTYRDSVGNREAEPIPIVNTATLAQITTQAAILLPLIDAVTDSVIEQASVTFSLDISGYGLKTDPNALGRNSLGALFGFDVTGSAYRTAYRLPALIPTYFSGDSVIVGANDVQDMIDELLTPTTAQVVFVNRYNEVVASLIGGRASRQKRKASG